MADKLRLFTVAGQEIPDRSDKQWIKLAVNLHKLLFSDPPRFEIQSDIIKNPRYYALRYYEALVTGKRHF